MEELKHRITTKNHRPIIFLPFIWNLLTGIISEELYDHIERHNLLSDEQRGSRKNTRRTKNQLMIDQAALRDSKKRRTNLANAWLDYNHPLVDYGDSRNGRSSRKCQTLLKEIMTNWKTRLNVTGKQFGEVNIERGIFQGDFLSSLLFVITMFPLTSILRQANAGDLLSREDGKINHLLFMDDVKLYSKYEKDRDSLGRTISAFSSDIGMDFGISKCTVPVLKKRKVARSERVELPEVRKLQSLKEAGGEVYKYMGLLEADGIKHEVMIKRLSKKYVRAVKKVLRSKMKGGNIMRDPNTWAGSLLRYKDEVVSWTKRELMSLHVKSRKLLTIYGALHPRANVSRLYISRKQEVRGLTAVVDCVQRLKYNLDSYLSQRKEGLLKAA